tara:strand:+ start:1730 stop:2077 length:348 start_codon:yes stop_codon:yes gene_type:complete
MRVIVCGGRDYANRERVNAVLDKLHREAGISRIIEGGAKGADRLASDWAESLAVPTTRYEADWEAHGTFAGPRRNATMLEDGQPDLVIAFPGGVGTRNMIRQARKAGVEVVEIAP